MKKLIARLVVFFAMAVAGVVSAETGDPRVENVQARQIPDTKNVEVTYDLVAPEGGLFTVSAVFQAPGITPEAKTLSGDIGPDVSPGLNRRFVWNAGVDWPGQVNGNFVCTVTAIEHDSDEEIEQDPSMGMVLIPAGTNAGVDHNFGAYSLTVKAFYMDRTEVTLAKWKQVYNWAVNHGYQFRFNAQGKGENYPIHTYHPDDLPSWCNARSEMEGLEPVYRMSGDVVVGTPSAVVRTPSAEYRYVLNYNGYRLPTQTEREYAARGGLVGKRFPWGDTISWEDANYCGGEGNSVSWDKETVYGYHPAFQIGEEPYTAPVASFPPNGYGLYDMCGNVLEAMEGSTWSSSGYVSSGGSWHQSAGVCLFRHPNRIHVNGMESGFRCVRNGQSSSSLDVTSSDKAIGVTQETFVIDTRDVVGRLVYEFRPTPDTDSLIGPTRSDFHLERASGRLCKAESDGGWREVASFKSGEPVDIIWGDGTYRVFFGYDNSEAFGEPVWVPFIECEDLTVPMAEDVSRIRYFYDRENYPLEKNGQPVKLMVYFNPGEHASCSPQVVELPESVYGRYPFVLESGDIPTPERLTEIDGTLIDGIARIFRFRGWFDGDWQIKGGTAFARGRTFMLGGEVREGVLLVAKWEVTEVEVGLSGTGAWWVEGSSTKWTFDHSFENLMSVSSVTPKPTGNLQIPEEMAGERVASIGRYAFSNCQGLTSVDIPEGVQSIGVQAFSGCYDLTQITFPSTLRTIEPYAFGWCTGLGYVEVPVGVTTIGEGAFTTCGYLETVVLPEGLTMISSNVFNYCCSLRTVTIPSTITKIEPTAFNACSNLGRVYVTPGDEERVSRLLSESGVDVSGIEFLGKTPEGLLIDHGLLIGFEGAMQPGEAVVVPECVTGMVDYVFAGLPMGSVVIPSSVKRISAYAFASCQQLNVVTLAPSIETVGDGAFSYCTGLGSIVLPAGVTNIGYGAFFSCTNLSTLVFDGNAPTVGERAFEGVPSSCTVVVRKGTLGWNVTIPGQWHGIKIVWCDDSATDEQPFSVSGLGWHEMSFPVLPEGGKPEDVFAPVADKIGYVTYGSKNWSPTSGGTLTALEIGKGYWVQTTAANVSWTMTGQGNPDVEIALKPGWNLIGYPLLEEGEVETVLATALATEKIDWIYSGSRVYPGTLTTMAPGKGYWVYANAAVTIKFDVK